jgi:co-chaperonin GroES (HSP10)
VGDKVIFNKYAGSLIDIHEEDGRKSYRLINDKDIFAILEE